MTTSCQERGRPAGGPALHRRLARFNAARLAPATPSPEDAKDWREELRMRRAEAAWLARLRAETVARLMASPPRRWGDADAFLAWFERLEAVGPGQHHPLFDWLAREANVAQMRWFLAQEVAGEAGFEDLLAYVQVKLPERPKLELARNYWDEMGRGKPRAMHGPLLARAAQLLGLRPTPDSTVVEALALGNTMVGLALNRGYAFHALGALGAIELTAPARAERVAAGMKRLGLPAAARAYFDLHATIDVHHSRAWNREVIAPLAGNALQARCMAEGALMRLLCGARCFDRYVGELGIRLAAA